MNRFENPFNDLWITERLDSAGFVKMFSPIVAQQSEGLFSTGNVVVKGRQGSGKSMLLGLLATRTRIAYARAGEDYPAPAGIAPFIAAGTNLIRDNAQIVSTRINEQPEDRRREWVAATFADYLNYLLIEDLLENVIHLALEQQRDSVLSEEISISWTESSQRLLLNEIKKSDVWNGYFSDCHSLSDLVAKVSLRLVLYRKYFNFNVDELDLDVANSRTPIAEPVAVIAESLRRAGVCKPETLIYLRIDQHEELHALESRTGNAGIFRQVINRALATRDSRVSYRIGTRHYAWSDELSIWGSGAPLEHMRDYATIDIDEIFQRHENSSRLLFPVFAEDVLRRRLRAYGFENADTKSLITHVFGKSMRPAERAKIYANNNKWVKLKSQYRSASWNSVLSDLWETDPLSAKLGDAWLRQKAQQDSGVHLGDASSYGFPWLSDDKQYWRKERNEVALMQIAGSANQSMIWSGDRHLVDLAGWNILAFMSICQKIWGAWLRKASDMSVPRAAPSIPVDCQVIGVLEASRDWLEKIREGANGEHRRRLIYALGTWFSRSLRKDKAISYPGHNGISLLRVEFLDSSSEICGLLRDCRDHGDLIESPHTTKSADGKPRIKWHLNPILCPFFRIPHIRTKEPIYTTISELESVYSEDEGRKRFLREPEVCVDDPQQSLFN